MSKRRRAAEAQRREFDEKARRTLAAWPDKRFQALVLAVERGCHHADEGQLDAEGWEDRPLAEVFELHFIAGELERRGWPPLVLGPPLRGAGSMLLRHLLPEIVDEDELGAAHEP